MNLQPIIDQALRFVGPPVLNTYKRLTTSTGGDALTGRYGSITTADTLLDPQPIYRQLGKDAEVLNAVGLAVSGTTYEFLVSSTALSDVELAQKNLSLVQKDAVGTQVLAFKIVGFTPVQGFGRNLTFKIFADVVTR